MVGLTALWLPIVLASIIVFAASSVIHMMSPWHKNDYPKLPNEDAVRDALRPLAIPPGEFSVPRPASTAEMKSPEFAEKMKNGPVIMMRVFPNGPISMGKNLAQWFVYTLVISLFSGYVAGRALPPGSNYFRCSASSARPPLPATRSHSGSSRSGTDGRGGSRSSRTSTG